jgi:Peptidase family M48
MKRIDGALPSFPGILSSLPAFKGTDARFLRLFEEAVSRPPPGLPRITTIRTVALSRRTTKQMVGLTRYSHVSFLVVFSRPQQTITFYSKILDQLSDPAAVAVIAHELAHAWLNEHVRPEESIEREREADRMAREWGFGAELDALDSEADTVY